MTACVARFPPTAHRMAKKKRPQTTLLQSLRGHAVKVMQALGKGHSERVYHRAMITSLNRQRVYHRSEVIAPIYFMGEVVGFGRCDIVIGDLVVEFKANMRRPTGASSQLKKYMESQRATTKRKFRGLIINFNQRTGGVETLFASPVPPATKRKQAGRKTRR
jgi:GxxExxY protein